jgi:carbon storage regulator CsrA
MLVLSRKKKESFVLDGGIKIEVLQIKRGSVRIGIEAPLNVSVRRSELQPARTLEPICVAAPELAHS